jgi:uncharacterized protein
MFYNLGDSEKLDSKTKDLSRVRQSLVEELQAINWYDERIQNSDDDSVIKVLTHNRDEEKEHAAMLINWLRKNDKFFDRKFNENDQS